MAMRRFEYNRRFGAGGGPRRRMGWPAIAACLLVSVAAWAAESKLAENDPRRLIGSTRLLNDREYIVAASPPYRRFKIKELGGYPINYDKPWSDFYIFDAKADGQEIIALLDADPEGRDEQKIFDVMVVGQLAFFDNTECKVRGRDELPVFAIGKRERNKNIERLAISRAWVVDPDKRKFQDIDRALVTCEIDLNGYD